MLMVMETKRHFLSHMELVLDMLLKKVGFMLLITMQTRMSK